MGLRDLFTLWKTQTMETGRKVWNLEYEESVQGRWKDNIKKCLKERIFDDVD
jgi:hypothetical protein